ncbi:hypothetical protein ACQJBY_061784 [Aegilops geniculata]
MHSPDWTRPSAAPPTRGQPPPQQVAGGSHLAALRPVEESEKILGSTLALARTSEVSRIGLLRCWRRRYPADHGLSPSTHCADAMGTSTAAEASAGPCSMYRRRQPFRKCLPHRDRAHRLSKLRPPLAHPHPDHGGLHCSLRR